MITTTLRTLAPTAAVTGALLIGMTAAQAAPVTVNLTGTIDSTYNVVTFGYLDGLFGIGDTFTITTTVDQDGAPDEDTIAGSSHKRRWYTGNVSSLTINGNTYTVGDAVTGYDDSFVEARTNSYDLMSTLAYDTTTGVGGGATSTLAIVDYVSIYWHLLDADGANDILNFADPRFPATINLADWTSSQVEFLVRDLESGSYAKFKDTSAPVFTSASASSGDTSVPAPGALALVSLGLIGFGLIGTGIPRRKAA
ncbi:MAG: PEP-CTERM sorting domain-containing protein [Rhodobacteraceae bacterium]|nr:PEP-CTERM sorting domain-containing protein [Paracoccaceae bacterium]